MKTAIYVRVSTDEQAKEGFSISAQIERLRAFALSQGWEVTNEYIEEGWSAKNIERPQLQNLLKDIKKKDIDIVLVYRLDRLTRSVLDLYRLLKTFDENNVAFRSATEVYDTSTAMGRLFITLVAALAQWERENLAERVKFGMSQMLDEGKRAGAVSNYGYKFDKDFNCEIIEHEANAVKMMFQLYLDGYGYQTIADKLNEEGIKPKRSDKWVKASVRQTLSNEIYIGKYSWSDYTKENNHPGIIDELVFRKVQKLMNEKNPSSTRRGKYLLTGLLRCGHCDHGMTGHEDKRRLKKNFTRYLCNKCNRSIAEYKIIDPLLNELERLISDKEYFISRLGEIDSNNGNYDHIKTELEKINKQKSKLLDLYMDDDSPFDKQEIYSRINKLNTQEQELQLQIDELEVDVEDPSDKYEKIKNLTNIREIFKISDLQLQKELLNSIFDVVYFYKDKSRNPHAPVKIEYELV